MAADITGVLDALRAYTVPRDGLGNIPFKLARSFDVPASVVEVAAAWPGVVLPAELIKAWLTSRESRLFEDVDYGQWGLILLSPAAAAERTTSERARRPTAYRDDDVVIGEFLGDQELVVLAPSEPDRGHVLIALPLDDRPDWYSAADDLSGFLKRYLEALGDKYWERPTR